MNRRRLIVLAVVLALGAGAIAIRSFQIAVFEHDRWQQLALRQQQKKIEVPSLRGTIRSADDYVLATSVERSAIQVDTKHLEYPEIFAQAAAPLLASSPELLEKRLQRGGRSVWLAKQVRMDVADEVRRLAPQAVVLVPDFERVYPLGSLAAPVVGFTGREELLTVGRAGFEHSYDAVLAGEPEQYLSIHDAIQRQVLLRRLHAGRAGSDLELTIVARLQASAEAALAASLSEHGALAGSAVVADAHSGAVLAIASLPSFDPATPGDSPPENWRLRAVQDAIEPGSTVKPMVAAAALAADAIGSGERFDCLDKGIRVAGHWVRDHADPGRYTVDEVVAYSANVGIIKIAERLPKEMLWRAFDAFGFGHKTGVGFPAEARGLVPATKTWSRMSPTGFALGQELTASPLQIAMAYATIANGGWLPRPHLLPPSKNSATAVSPRARVLDEALAARIRSMLEDVVLDGTGAGARIPGFRVAGKTGTAQRAVGGTFDDEHHVAWFAGFFPMPDPRVVIVVSIEEAQVADFWGSTIAAPVFADIAAAAAAILDLPPTEPAEDPTVARSAGPESEAAA
ncbi:MAG: penicillin-binding protein 2 [Holophagae bacterium]